MSMTHEGLSGYSPDRSEQGAHFKELFKKDDRKNPSELLSDLVDEQLASSDRAIAAALDIGNVDEIIQVYKNSGLYGSVTSLWQDIKMSQGITADDVFRLQGRVFADIAYLLMLHNFHQASSMVLSEEQTFRLYRRSFNVRATLLGQEPPEIMYNNLSTSLAGITVPDGLLVEDVDGVRVISEIIEYTTRDREDNYRPKTRSNLRARARIKTYTNGSQNVRLFAEGARIRFVIPDNGVNEQFDSVANRYPPGIVQSTSIPDSFRFMEVSDLILKRQK